MKHNVTTSVLLILSGSLCLAQTSGPAEVNDFKPAVSNQAGKEYPQVNSEGRARFRIVAPQARSVTVDLRGRTVLTKGEDGAWVGTTQPLDEGFHYYQIIMHNLDKFAYIGAFSGTMNGLSSTPLDPATAFNGLFKDGEALNKQIKLLWIGMGTKEPDFFQGSIGAFRAMLDKAGVHYVYYQSPGTAHEWLTWRRDLHEFAPRLFRD